MVEAAPSTPFIMAEPDLLLELLVVAFYAPAHFGKVGEASERRLGVERREPIFGGLGLILGPLDQQRLLTTPRSAPDRRRANAQAGKSRRQLGSRTLAPGDRAPSVFGQPERKFFDAHALFRRDPIPYRMHFDPV